MRVVKQGRIKYIKVWNERRKIRSLGNVKSFKFENVRNVNGNNRESL